MSVGTIEDARRVFAVYHEQIDDDEVVYLGDGCYRTAYMLNGVVYKVGNPDSNSAEVINSRRLRHPRIAAALKAINVYIPAARLWRVPSCGYATHEYVVAMEYIERDYERTFNCVNVRYDYVMCDYTCSCKDNPTCSTMLSKRIMEITGLTDSHDENLIFDTAGKLWMIDLGA